MNDDNIKINVELLTEDLNILKQCIDDFEPYSSDFIINTRNTFETFNSDFISKMDSVIKHLSNDTAQDIIDGVNDMYTITKGIVDSFVEYDKSASGK